MAMFTGRGAFTPPGPTLAPNQIRIGFDPKSIREVISGCWGMAAYTSALAWRYSREVAFETYRGIVQQHPRDTRFSVRQIQVNYTINNIESTRGEFYDKAMSNWIMIGMKPGGVPRFRMRRSNVDENEYKVVWKKGQAHAVRLRNDPPAKPHYADPEKEQMARVRLLSGERHRGMLMPTTAMLPPEERASFTSWSKRKTIFVFSNARYEKYLNYGGADRPGKFYWELSFAQAVSKADQQLLSIGGFTQKMITEQESAIQNYRGIVNSFIREQWVATIDPMF